MIEVIVIVTLVAITALAISARLALRPIVDALLTLKDAFQPERKELEAIREDVARLWARMGKMEDVLQRLEESEEFYGRLLESQGSRDEDVNPDRSVGGTGS